VASVEFGHQTFHKTSHSAAESNHTTPAQKSLKPGWLRFYFVADLMITKHPIHLIIFNGDLLHIVEIVFAVVRESYIGIKTLQF